ATPAGGRKGSGRPDPCHRRGTLWRSAPLRRRRIAWLLEPASRRPLSRLHPSLELFPRGYTLAFLGGTIAPAKRSGCALQRSAFSLLRPEGAMEEDLCSP